MLRQLPTPNHEDPNVLVGFETGDDAAVYRISGEVALVLTVDFFPPIVDEPFDYGAIAATNALSDVYAVGGRPISALNVAGFPRELPKELLAQVLAGGMDKAAEAGCSIVGGHTVDDREPKYGLAVTGVVQPGKQVTNAAAQPGDRLVLTKPIGTGVVTTAHKNDVAPPEALAAAVESMKTLNKGASEAMTDVGVSAATDITGFGLLGHLHSMMKASGTSARVNRNAVPALPGVLELIDQDVAPGGTHRNMESLDDVINWSDALTTADRLFLCDAQTSGGLLISVPPNKTDQLLARLTENQTPCAAIIGQVTQDNPGRIQATP